MVYPTPFFSKKGVFLCPVSYPPDSLPPISFIQTILTTFIAGFIIDNIKLKMQTSWRFFVMQHHYWDY